MYQAFQYRIQPTVEQEAALASACSFCVNWALQQPQVYQQTQEVPLFLPTVQTSHKPQTTIRYLWLNVPFQCLQQKLKVVETRLHSLF